MCDKVIPLKVTNGSCWNDSPLRWFTVWGSFPKVVEPRKRNAQVWVGAREASNARQAATSITRACRTTWPFLWFYTCISSSGPTDNVEPQISKSRVSRQWYFPLEWSISIEDASGREKLRMDMNIPVTNWRSDRRGHPPFLLVEFYVLHLTVQKYRSQKYNNKTVIMIL